MYSTPVKSSSVCQQRDHHDTASQNAAHPQDEAARGFTAAAIINIAPVHHSTCTGGAAASAHLHRRVAKRWHCAQQLVGDADVRCRNQPLFRVSVRAAESQVLQRRRRESRHAPRRHSVRQEWPSAIQLNRIIWVGSLHHEEQLVAADVSWRREARSEPRKERWRTTRKCRMW
jgi:hypothetical protein